MPHSIPSALALPEYIVLITAVHSVTGEELSTYAWADDDIEKITNDLIGLQPHTSSSSSSSPPIPSTSKESSLTPAILSRSTPYPHKFVPHPTPSNLLILLPSNGESTPSNNYLKLAQKLSLPDTSILSLLGAEPLPFDLGNSWLADMDYATGEQLPAAKIAENTEKCAEGLRKYIKTLFEYFNPESVFVLGYGLGSSLGLSLINEGGFRLGGLIAIGGGAGSKFKVKKDKVVTPVMEIVKDDGWIGLSAVEKRALQSIETFKGKGAGMGMSEAECKKVMEFLGGKMQKRMKGMEGMCKQP
ncbi:hypothetical protein TrVE_jg385 [Triparma verrucosa]|uniref:Phospholipase/carboxylesterase/thioesterase domain-containing protein n=2 Tax=Triparma TaxID=722752 RepID=A0A9W7EC42_9STRA|nr:hypothetical protein TrST_g36 [Triparma strigata]GMI05855.1 hypothetical protein TrVE_jg385 [Triparma verrucosa]